MKRTLSFNFLCSVFGLGVLLTITSCDVKNSILTDPLPDPEVKAAILDFRNKYRGIESNYANVNLKVILDSTTRQLLQDHPIGNGIVFQYGYSDQTNNLCYLIGLGQQNNAGFFFTNQPFPETANIPYPHYILLDGSAGSGYSIVNANTLNAYRNKYRTSLERKTSFNNWVLLLNVNDHPRMVFHQSPELLKFDQAYRGQNPTYLYLEHGTAKKNGWLSGRYHVPILRLGNVSGPFPLIVNPDTYVNEYSGNALDAGHVCPPHCNAIEYQRDDK